MLRTASRQNPLTPSEIYRKLEDLGFSNRSMADQLIEEEKERFFSRGFLVGLRLVPDHSERGIYIQSRSQSLLTARPGKQLGGIAEASPLEVEESLLSPLEVQLLVYRLSFLRDQFRQLGVNVKVENPAVRKMMGEVENLARLSPNELEVSLVSAIGKLSENLHSLNGDVVYQNQKQSAEYQWLLSTCEVIDIVYQMKTGQSFFELLRFSPEEWSNFLANIYYKEMAPFAPAMSSLSEGRTIVREAGMMNIPQLPRDGVPVFGEVLGH